MKRILLLLAVLSLTACEHQVPQEEPLPSFESHHYRFNVSRVDVVDDFVQTHVARTEFKPDVSLADALHAWADSSLTAGGAANILELHITNADIVRKELPKQNTGIVGMFTEEQTEQYDGTLTVELKLYTPERTLPVAHSEVTAQLSHTLREDATLEDRKALYRRMTAEIMAEMQKTLDSTIHTYFANYLM